MIRNREKLGWVLVKIWKKNLFKNNFSLVGLNEFNNTSLVIFSMLFHILITMLVMAPFPWEVVLIPGTLKWPFVAKEVSYWWKYDEKVNQLLKIEGKLLCI